MGNLVSLPSCCTEGSTEAPFFVEVTVVTAEVEKPVKR